MSLTDLHARLSQVYASIQSFNVPLPQLPLIDSSLSHERDNKQALPGLRFLREQVKRDCEVLDKVKSPLIFNLSRVDIWIV